MFDSILFSNVSICRSVISLIILKSAALPLLFFKYELVESRISWKPFETSPFAWTLSYVKSEYWSIFSDSIERFLILGNKYFKVFMLFCTSKNTFLWKRQLWLSQR